MLSPPRELRPSSARRRRGSPSSRPQEADSKSGVASVVSAAGASLAHVVSSVPEFGSPRAPVQPQQIHNGSRRQAK